MEKSPPHTRKKNREIRPGGEHLTEAQVESVIKAAASSGRHGARDSLMVLLSYTHALRARELLGMSWDQVNLDAGKLYVRRLKGSVSGEHPLRSREIRALKKLTQDRQGPVFTNERGGPLSLRSIHIIVARAGRLAGLGVPIHPHMLRHSCGYKMINDGVDIRIIQVWMGHANIQNTAQYSALNTSKLKGLWDD
jgi:integrase